MQNCFKQWEVELCIDKAIGQLIKVRTPRTLKKLSRWITKLATANIALHLVLKRTKPQWERRIPTGLNRHMLTSHVSLYFVKRNQWFSTWGSWPPERSWSIFGRVASRCFLYTIAFALFEFHMGDVGLQWVANLLEWVAAQKRLKTTDLNKDETISNDLRNSYQYSNVQSRNWTESCKEGQKNIIHSSINLVKQKW